MTILKWLTFIVLFSASLSIPTETFDSTLDYSTSEISTFSTADDFPTDSSFDYGLNKEDSVTATTFDYESVITDSTPENAYRPSDAKNLQYPPYDRDCPVHEHWEFCTGLCQRNCSNWSKALICPDICVQGCLCDWGFTRGPEGNCIPVSECPPLDDQEPIKINIRYKCRRNEHFSACGADEECQKNCSDYEEEASCDRPCTPGCICNEGFVRGRTGKCVPIEKCHKTPMRPTSTARKSLPKLCKRNEHFSACSGLPMCQKSCSNYNEPIVCPLICVPGCVCDRGYVIGPNGQCVLLENCPFEMESSSAQDAVTVSPLDERKTSDCSNGSQCDSKCKAGGYVFGVCIGYPEEFCSCFK